MENQRIETTLEYFLSEDFNFNILSKFKIEIILILLDNNNFADFKFSQYQYCNINKNSLVYESINQLKDIRNTIISLNENSTQLMIDLDSEDEIKKKIAKLLIDQTEITGKLILELHCSVDDFASYMRNN